MKKKKSIYEALGLPGHINPHPLAIHSVIRLLRHERKLSGAELCRRSGLDPRTLTALEKGRIRNPSIKTLQAVAKGLQLQVSDLFKRAEMEEPHHFFTGTQKGFFQLDFPPAGIKVVSFTPFVQDFFCGKIILSSRKRWEDSLMKHPFPLFLSILIGRVEVTVEGRKIPLKEGENVFFNGSLKHSVQNMLEKESVLLMVTAPSFAGSREAARRPISYRK